MNNPTNKKATADLHTPARIVLTIVLLCAAGCVNLSKKHPPRSYFVLKAGDQTPGIIPEHQENKPCLMLRSLTISPLFAGKEFVYRLTDNQYQSDYYNLFFTSPANMLREQLARKLSCAKAYNFVFSNTTELTPEYSMEVYVTALYGDFRDPEKPQAAISMVVYLIRQHEDQNQLVITQSYRNQQPLPKRTATALVNGWNQGLDDLLTQLQKDITAIIQDAGEANTD